MRRSIRRRRAFTLIELLVVLAVIMVLLSMLIPSLARAKELARMAICRQYDKRLCTAALMYHQDFGCLPPPGFDYHYQGSMYNVKHYWYQWPMLGRLVAEDIPKNATIQGYCPPQKSIVRCPSEPVRTTNKKS
jgi:prepilin-type N-terminal cleavage/methylation domain-containing protein